MVCEHCLAVQDVTAAAEELSDEQLCQLLEEHLHIDARPNFADAIAPASMQQKRSTEPRKVYLFCDSKAASAQRTSCFAYLCEIERSMHVVSIRRFSCSTAGRTPFLEHMVENMVLACRAVS